jgi:FkbM family methyltransferase
VRQIIFKFARFLERNACALQGKGYGAGTVDKEVKVVLSLLKATPRLAIDIGGNIGNYTAELRKMTHALEIHVFEPSKVNTSYLERRFNGDALVKVISAALSDQTGVANLFSDRPGSTLGSLSKRKLDHFNMDFSHREVVSTIRFEDYWREQLAGRHLDLVKIDVEGHELEVLEGFGDALANVAAIQFEFGGANIDSKTYFQNFWYFFKDRGFNLYRITPFGPQELRRYSESEEFFSTTNYVALNTDVV